MFSMQSKSLTMREAIMSNETIRSSEDQVSGLTKVAGELTRQSSDERAHNRRLLEITSSLLPSFGNQWNSHNIVTLKRQSLSRILYYNELYRKIVEIPGVICEFGVQRGAPMAQLINFRGIYVPFNHSRKIVGFDTFEGFPYVDEKDGCFPDIVYYATAKFYHD